MRHDHKGHAVIGWHSLEERFQRLDAARRGTDADDGKIGRHRVLPQPYLPHRLLNPISYKAFYPIFSSMSRLAGVKKASFENAEEKACNMSIFPQRQPLLGGVGGVTARRGAQGTSRMLSRSISGIGSGSDRATALASSL